MDGDELIVWPFKKRALIAEDLPIDGPWRVAQGKHNGKPMFVRTNMGYRSFRGVIGYEHQVGIAVPLRAPQPNGLPSSEEIGDLDFIEDTICSLLETGRESLFVAVINTSGMREFVLYTRSPEQVKQKFEQLRSGITSHTIQLMIQPDKDWQVYMLLSR
jgi:hypothetical protein